MDYTHIPVMQRELVHFIEISRRGGAGVLADCTVGEGGHSELLLSKFTGMRIVAFDRDAGILEIAKGRLKQYAGRIDYINDNFFDIGRHLDSLRGKMDYFLYDFGISSYHYEKSGRGFAFARDEVLDMRLDGRGESARHVVNTYEEKMLADIIYRYGEERWARKIAAAICRERSGKSIETTGELANIVLRAIPKKFHVRNIHPATRVFQALRIQVNDELRAMEKSLAESHRLLASGGMIMAISFHSLEDRIVKEKFRRLSRGCACQADQRDCRCVGIEPVKILTKKPLRPQVDETELNPRARSARLRVCEKV